MNTEISFDIDAEIEKNLADTKGKAEHYTLKLITGVEKQPCISSFVTLVIFLHHAKVTIGANSLSCCPGNILIMKEKCSFSILPGQTTLSSGKANGIAYILDMKENIFTDLFYSQLPDCPIFYDFFRLRAGTSEYLFFDNSDSDPVFWCSRQLVWEASFTSKKDEKNLLAAFVVFITNLHRTHQWHLVISESSMMTEYKAGRFLKYMADHYRTVSLESIASEFGYSPAYFSTMFKNMVWVTFTDKLLELKLEQAKRFLITTDLSIEVLAMEAGFTEKSYFHRCFKKIFGMTPGKYRKLNK
ncbi:AraC family transcriptional regulator [uncultured Sphaerochaeta sp.]|uniref:helix-turn-helix domain-containing protein n=1 Tax=uncultured Sphaerochaeta sp. TaxID=886478 RepID=UPI002A0A6B84|nr:AraC family transcriptional regulator [uncultured Sphaerochaeta sp.]